MLILCKLAVGNSVEPAQAAGAVKRDAGNA